MTEYAGYRTQRRQQQRQKRTWPWIVLALVAALVLAFVVLGAVVKVSPIEKAWRKSVDGLGWFGHQVKSLWPFKSRKKAVASDFLPRGKKTVNCLVAVTKQISGTSFLSTVVLASYDSKTSTGSLIFFPNDLLVAAPGMGSDQISNLVELDGARIDMTKVTIENILGTDIDRYVLGSDRDLAMILGLFRKSFMVTVPSRISYKDPSLKVTVDLKPGMRKLDAMHLASYLTYGPSGKALDLAKRQADYVPALISILGSGDVNAFVAENIDLFDTDASAKELAGMLKAYASLKGGALQAPILPVKEFRYEKTVVNRIDQDALPDFVRKYVKSSHSDGAAARVKVELLNGCGVPGIGQKVASQIDLTKYRVVNSANAESFDNPETLVIVYSEDKSMINAANELRDELEVGKVVSQPGSRDLSDISVVVGKDYASK